jgi:hypothetical protein
VFTDRPLLDVVPLLIVSFVPSPPTLVADSLGVRRTVAVIYTVTGGLVAAPIVFTIPRMFKWALPPGAAT